MLVRIITIDKASWTSRFKNSGINEISQINKLKSGGINKVSWAYGFEQNKIALQKKLIQLYIKSCNLITYHVIIIIKN